MTLFEAPPQYREKAALWRIFSLLPLYGHFASGRIWRWFAINIPMDLGTDGTFTSDIDILACLRGYPDSKELIFRTWEVKVSLLCRDGSVRSLKAGKTARTITQLKAYRKFGAPEVTLIQVFICEDGFLMAHGFPPAIITTPLLAKMDALREQRFGYQLLGFEHDRDGDYDLGLKVIRATNNPMETMHDLLPAAKSQPRDPFCKLVRRLNDFFVSAGDGPRKPFTQIVFCKSCHRLQLIDMKKSYTCPTCGDDLIEQS